MSYIKAENILPQDLIEVIQQYVSGVNIYIPSKEKLDWGSRTHSKQYYAARNQNICNEYENGLTVIDLSKKYSLSEKSVYRVLRSQNI